MASNPDRKPTVLDNILTFISDHPEWVAPQALAAARREVEVLRELCESVNAVWTPTYETALADAADRREIQAVEQYRQWRAEQQQ